MSLFPFPFPGGSIAPPPDRPAWTTYERMLRVAPSAAILKQRAGRDDPDFLAVREDVTADLIRTRSQVYGPRPGFILRRYPTPLAPLGTDRPDPTIVPPTAAAFAAALTGGGVLVDDVLEEAVARLALGEVFGRQEEAALNDEANRQQAKAALTLSTYRLQVTIAGVNYLVAPSGLEITLLPS